MIRLFLFLITLALAGQAQAVPLRNALAGHASPYLALHGQDPVAWQEWNAETLARAKRENKLLFVSLGYFSCHWCHVMQKESYRDPAIAALLNKHFIPVKVDRELNGALDAALLDFAEGLNGVSGWPLNVFVTPEGFPAYAVLYAPPDEFRDLLTRLADTWKSRADDLRQAAREAAPTAEPLKFQAPSPALARERERAYLAAAWRNADTLQGGFSRVSKFPMALQLARLLEIQARDRDPKLAAFLQLTLDQMARRGLRDHVNGGFFRYTVDPDWHTPHFEKMLADNAQLAVIYARAAQVLQRPDYLGVAHDTLDFLLTSLAAPGGGYFTALSALDHQGREGGGYLWTREALKARLSAPEYALAARVWGLEAAAAFPLGYLPQEMADPTPQERARLQAILAKLQAQGRHKDAPRDTKINAGLNGLALSALVQAGRGVPRFEAAARDLGAFMGQSLVRQGRLVKTRAGKRIFPDAELDDYAYAVTGLLDLASAQDNPKAADLSRQLAHQLAGQAWQTFFSQRGWQAEARPLLATLQPAPALPDGALPSASARLMAASARLLAARPDFNLARQLERARGLALPAMALAPFEHPSGLGSIAFGIAP